MEEERNNKKRKAKKFETNLGPQNTNYKQI